MIKRLSVISVLALLLVVILLLAPGSACDQGAKQAEVPPGPIQVMSFKVVNENVAPGDVPLFTWEAANASAVTITQDGEEVFHIESIPDSSTGAFLTPLHGVAYASTMDENELRQPYSPGIYPVGFKGASNGKPSKIISDFGDNITKQGFAEIKALSDDGQVIATKVTFFNFAADGQGSSPPQITAPPCVNRGSSEPIIPVIKRWVVKNPVIQDGEAPQLEFEVSNPHVISIRHGDEYISSVEIINPQLTSSMSMPPFTDEAHASTTGESEVKQPYVPGVYPVIYQGSSSGRPATIIWKFGEKSRDDSAQIIVCSSSGDVMTAMVNFTIMRVEDQVQPPAAPQPPVISFNASRNIVAAMDPVTFTWNVTGDNLTVKMVSDGVQHTVQPSGSGERIMLKSACYYITAENPWGRDSKSQCVTVQSSGIILPPVFIEPPCPPTPPPPPPPPHW